MSKPTPAEINANLANFYGSETFTRYTNSILTDGAKYVAEACGAFWLLDIICSVQLIAKVKREEFQVFSLVVKGQSATVTVTDGNDHVIYTQEIPYTDFPLPKIDLWRVNGTIMLPSEY